jgi:hypothetical protein
MSAQLACVTIEEVAGPGGVRLIQAGSTISDAGVQAAYLSAGGVLVPATDAVLGPQAAIVQKARARGANEDTCSRMMLAALGNAAYTGAVQGAVQRQSLAQNLAAIKALTSGTAFNIGAALPTNAQLVGVQASWTEITGGALSAVSYRVGDATTDNNVLGATDVWGSLGPASASLAQARGGVQIKGKLTATGDTLANATAGQLTTSLLYVILP